LEEKIIELASSQGIWAALSIILIFYILKNQEKRDIKQEERESKFQQIIIELTNKLEIIENVNDTVNEIKDCLFK
jgi:hypothetical protein